MLPSYVAMLQPAEAERIGEQLLDLVALALAAQGRREESPALSAARAVALLQLRSAIEARLDDPSLDPETAAAAAGISVRYANAILAEQGMSLQRLIVARRLERCRLDLENPQRAHLTVSEIAYGWGFSDTSHFNRRFKAAFGCTPSECRRRSHD
ncbi:MAG: helix-turn-helix domain-containing protein [Hyphomicrobium sp.]|uniref:helix-turn-helix domain-containing protein n=1 Tax=Hyphomicrobium sp. TaxID=82 RepID=UPI00132C60A1|nr:helix-turn-helix domain-containing protein [Hyphomicrobium sp.]KAB2939486.1 MAG: helix-turn-helix domain-containing protein [Hyphomicrobium sp.]MBZ0211250.1 helix-turn-helix domain-containing protein [Hyphomicrobium sp.]